MNIVLEVETGATAVRVTAVARKAADATGARRVPV
jgi:hypothetical protein